MQVFINNFKWFWRVYRNRYLCYIKLCCR